MPLEVAAWLIILAVLIVGFLIVLHRMSLLIGRTRDLEQYQRAVAALDARLGALVEPLEQGLGDIRRHAGDPAALRGALDGAQAGLAALDGPMSSRAQPSANQALRFLMLEPFFDGSHRSVAQGLVIVALAVREATGIDAIASPRLARRVAPRRQSCSARTKRSWPGAGR